MDASKSEFDPSKIFQYCNLEDLVDPDDEYAFKKKICQDKYQLRAEDEISIDSLISGLLSMVVPVDEEISKCERFKVTYADKINKNRAILFGERLIISRFIDPSTECASSAGERIVSIDQIERIGDQWITMKEGYSGINVNSHCQMIKGVNKVKCGFYLKGRYDDKFILICEKRREYDVIDGANIEKLMTVKNNQNRDFIFVRESKINEISEKLTATIKIKNKTEMLLMQGGVILLMRFLIINKFIGKYVYYTVNMFGKVVKCVLTVHEEPQKMKIFDRQYRSLILVENEQFFHDELVESDKMYFQSNGRIIAHIWPGFNYFLHATHYPVLTIKRGFPLLEETWMDDSILRKKYEGDKKLYHAKALRFLLDHPEFSSLLYDYIICIIKYKPQDVLHFTIKFFRNLKATY